jgi:hypothetical protein
MTAPWWQNDERLFQALRHALQPVDVSPQIIDSAKGVYAWRTIDAELAALAQDSWLEKRPDAVLLRDETAAIRTLTFEASSLTIEIGVTAGGLVGQLVPPQSGIVELWTATATEPASTVDVDQVGWFAIDHVPSGAFRCRCRLADGATVVVTDWVAL